MPYEWEASDWLSVRWPGTVPFNQPFFSSCLNDHGDAFEESFGNPPVWNPPYLGTQANNSYGDSLPLSPGINGVTWNSDLVPRASPVQLNPNTNPIKVDYSFYEEAEAEAEDGGDGVFASEDYKTTAGAPPPTAKSPHKSAWKSPVQALDPQCSTATLPVTKRQKCIKTSDSGTLGLNIPSGKTCRRSQRKASLSTKSSQSYMDISTGSSSPEIMNDFENRAAALNTKRSHNLTEKKYRNRLNGYFDTLLSAIPRKSGASDSDSIMVDVPEKKVSKGEVLVLALEYIHALEKQKEFLEQEKKTLGDDLERLQRCLG
jgi:hypothetical protein